MTLLAKPALVQTGESVQTFEIDMYRIKGEFADGEWNELVEKTVQEWVSKEAFGKRATIWLAVAPSVNFGHSDYSAFLAPVGFPESFIGWVYAALSPKLKRCVRLSDFVIVEQGGGWEGYLHVTKGQTWKPCDSTSWISVE